MRMLDRIATAIVLLLGLGHVVATLEYAPGFTQAAAWFSGSGLALVFTAFLNLCRLSALGSSPRLTRLCLVANILALAWIAFIVAVLPVPQALVAGAAVLVVTIASFSRRQVSVKPIG